MIVNNMCIFNINGIKYGLGHKFIEKKQHGNLPPPMCTHLEQ